MSLMKQVYLDNNATTPMDPEVFETMRSYYVEDFGNASSIHLQGQRARSAVEDARAQVAELIGAKTKEIVFTSGGTESDNTAVRGVAAQHLSQGDHIITSTIEHSAVLRSCEHLEKKGLKVTYVPVDRHGILRLDRFEEALTEQTVLVSIIHGNNEIGVIQPITQLVEIARQQNLLFHTDAVQTVGKIPICVSELAVDLLALSAHKFHGPKGVGVLYVREETSLQPLLFGGSHERSRRAGTLDVPGIVGLGKACELAGQALEDLNSRVRKLRDRLEAGILQQIPDTVVNGCRENRLPHITNISFCGLDGEALLISLDFQGVAVSTGSACSSGSIEPSHVLTALGGGQKLRDSAIRFSLSRMTTESDIGYILQILPEIVQRMREVSPLYQTG